jgi:hypothetical protein
MENSRYLKNMLVCGSNKRVNEMDWSDKFSATLRGDGSELLSPVRVIFKNGVERRGYPALYLPGLDYSGDDGYAKIGIRFNDTGKVEIVRFRLFQQEDDNKFFRMCGNKIPFSIDLTQTGAVKLPLPNKGYMPKEVKQEIARELPDVWENYIKSFIFGYERALVKVNTIYRNVMMPLETELQMYKNAYNMGSDNEVSGLAEYKRIHSDGNFKQTGMRGSGMNREMEE